MNKEDWKKLGKVLATKGLPLLGAVLSGPEGLAVSSTGALISSVLGEDTDGNPGAMLQAINARPELLVELKRVEAQNKMSLQQMLLRQTELFLEDRKDARSREVEVTKTTGKRDVNLYVLAWTVVIGFMGIVVILALTDNPFTENPASLILLGALAAGFGSVLQYFFGSSQGSKDKAQAMVAMFEAKR